MADVTGQNLHGNVAQWMASNWEFLAKVGCHNLVGAFMYRFAGRQVSGWHLEQHGQLLSCHDDTRKSRSEHLRKVARRGIAEKGRFE